MKKNVLIFGLLAGFIVSTFMAVSMIKCYQSKDFEGSMVLGFSAMIIAFSTIFIAIKNYRDNYNAGLISFKRAFYIGILITLLASTLYVVTWLVVYYNFLPNFMELMTADSIAKIEANKALSSSEVNEQIASLKKMNELYENPAIVVAFTYIEIFPVGLIITLLSSLILKRNAVIR
jgi:hypothetical protein